MLTLQQFAAAIGCTHLTAGAWHAPMLLAMARFAIDTPVRRAAFLAQVGHESAGLARVEEDLRYGAQRILEVWPARFPGGVAEAMRYAYQPEMLANRVYGPRSDLGNHGEASGDGWRYRGRGPLQITGRDNYTRCGAALDRPIMEYPDLVSQDPRIGAMVAGWVWQDRGCNESAADIDEVSDRINRGRPTPRYGDANGFADRVARFERAMQTMEA